ncbi:polyribonucleotide nucleotidyltransferase [Limnoglobus roseus]|uniref:Polyribonucleotide nucleotidyltransferase n=1 Tax=Limnoglobus roseus TaxID=2598579 RepID=A0A5C1ACC7_9BACT|nr:polyribonucleotide nucleotidyltransferase [Limnoglobus roseus]QEL16390.1 polyribonucleotide nucleotidyltransferase [Limnoglobus roseus]
MQVTRVEKQIGHATLILETGKLAKQAHGAVTVQYGETMVLVAATMGGNIPGRDFFPLTVDYREKTYAAGKFPGGFIKRETRPSTKETLVSRLIDRPIRPLFPADFTKEVQVMCNTLSFDGENDPDMLAMVGASAALHISPMPFTAPIAGVRVGRVDGQLVVNPTATQMETSDLDLIVAGTKEAITMIEGFAREMPEQEMGDAIMFAHKNIVEIIGLVEELRTKAGLATKELPPPPAANPLVDELHKKYGAEFRKKYLTEGKLARYAALDEFKAQIKKEYLPEGDAEPKYTADQVSAAVSALREKIFREITLSGTRIDGRPAKQIRPLWCEVGPIPRVHGSAVFQRGETQALVIATLGTMQDEQKVDGLLPEYSKKFMLDYNFPPFSVGECKPIRGPGRREIGHGMLAERSLKAVMPNPAKFPYTVRLVSEILESNGSSSMASVCGGTLALMDAGVPIRQPVAGISIGLVMEKDQHILITDIQGDEDHYGDMDFKIAGTQNGITGIQLDIKLDGINEAIVRAALEQGKDARREILRTLLKTLISPRKEISINAPRLLTVKINPEKIGLLIGPGGKTIRAIQEETGAKLDVDNDGTVQIAHSDAAGADEAKRRVEALCEEVKVGKIYDGKVSSIKDFGAFIEIMPGRDGLCHISELDHGYVGRVDDVVRVGDKVQVKVIGIDDQDRVKLSRKALLAPPPPREGGDEGGDQGGPPPRERGGDRGDRGDRGERRGGGDRGGRERSGGGDRGGDRGGHRDRD